MDAPTLDRMVTDLLLMDTSDGLDRVASELSELHHSWVHAGVSTHSLDWLAGLVADLNWWSGRLLGGLSFAQPPQVVPDNTSHPPVS